MEIADTEANHLLIHNPKISAATFMNLLKSKGIQLMKVTPSLNDGTEVKPTSPPSQWRVWERFPILPKKKKEADSASTAPVGILAAQESKLVINPKSFRFIEKQGPDRDVVGPTKFRVKIIEEGMGNSNDAYYYSKEAIQSAVPIFEGKKIYADHPSRSEEQDRPERSVRDVVGHFENVAYSENDKGRACIEADASILPDEPYRWARGLMRHAVEYSQKFPDKDFIGISINASGDAQPKGIKELLESGLVPEEAKLKLEKALSEGIESVKMVTQIKDAISADLVTEAGAGGKVMKLVESNQGGSMEKEGQVEGKEKKEAEGHEDVEQDKKLILDMIKKHMDGEVEPEKEPEEGDKEKDPTADDSIYEAYQAYCEMGYEKEAAIQATSHTMKLARHMNEKSQKEGKEPCPPPEKKESEPKEKDEVKESEIIKLKGENAKLKETLSKHDLDKHIEKTLSDSKLARSVTKKIREASSHVKTVVEFDKIFKVFMEGYKAQTEAGEGTPSDIVIQPEKAPLITDSKGLSFEDCVRN